MNLPQIDELTLMHNTICRALGDPRRIQIMYCLSEQPRHVTAICAELDIPQPTVSRHLGLLRSSGLVEARREGASVIYSLSEPRIIEILETMRLILRDALERRANVLE